MPLFNPSIRLSSALPLKVGGSPNAGAYGARRASAYDHIHALLETSGPTNLDLGGILTGEMVRRVAGLLIGRQFDILRLASSAVTTVTAAANVDSDLTTTLKAGVNYMVLWVIPYGTAAVTTGLRVALNYSGTMGNNLMYGIIGASGPTTMQSALSGVFDTLLGLAGVGPGGTAVVTVLYAIVRTSTSGVLSARFASGVAGSAATIYTNSHMLVIQL